MADVTTLLDELAAWVAEQLGVAYETAEDGLRGLFTYRIDREHAEGVASVLRLTGGPGEGHNPTVTVTVQCMTQGPTEQAAMQRAWAIHELMLTARRLPKRDWTLTTWRILRIDALAKPQAVGPLDGGGADVSQNWIIEAVPLAA